MPASNLAQSPQSPDDPARQRIVQLTTQLLNLRVSGQIDNVQDLLTEDCVGRLVGIPSGAASYPTLVGRDAVLRMLRENHLEFEFQDTELLHFIVEGNDVALVWKARIRYRASGPDELVEGIAHLRFRDGRLAHYTNVVTLMSIGDP